MPLHNTVPGAMNAYNSGVDSELGRQYRERRSNTLDEPHVGVAGRSTVVQKSIFLRSGIAIGSLYICHTTVWASRYKP
jgi:hypothetical protein